MYEIPYTWNHLKLWDQDHPVVTIVSKNLEWNLHRKVWGTSGDVPISPLEAFSDPWKYHYHTKRILNADLAFLLHVTRYEDKWWILDGLHRLTLAIKVHNLPRVPCHYVKTKFLEPRVDKTD